MQHSFFRFFGASDLTLQDFDCQPLEGSDRGLFHMMVLQEVIGSYGPLPPRISRG